MEEMKFYTLEEVEDKLIGSLGTPSRDRYEANIQDFLVGVEIRKAREAKHLTQEQLAERMGITRAQVSRIEHGKNLSINAIRRAFKALGVQGGSLELGPLGKITLW